MRTLDDALTEFAYHPATPETVKLHTAVRQAYLRFVAEVWDLIPDGPLKTLALRDLQSSQYRANAAVAMLAPAVAADAPLIVREIPAGTPTGPAAVLPPATPTPASGRVLYPNEVGGPR